MHAGEEFGMDRERKNKLRSKHQVREVLLRGQEDEKKKNIFTVLLLVILRGNRLSKSNVNWMSHALILSSERAVNSRFNDSQFTSPLL